MRKADAHVTDETPEHPENRPDDGPPLHAEFRFQPVSARVPESISPGQFANGAIVMSGPHEFLIDFVLRLHQPNSIVGRVVLPFEVTGQFIRALQSNLRQYEKTFGPIAPTPMPLRKKSSEGESIQPAAASETNLAQTSGTSSTNQPQMESLSGDSPGRRPPVQIDEIYDGLKFPEKHQSGSYANAVLIRHTNTEFCFDFVANFYPRPIVVNRFFLAVGQVLPFLNSVSHSYEQRFGRREENERLGEDPMNSD